MRPNPVLLLSATETWERFTYYAMRGILVLFLVGAPAAGGFGLADREATAIYGLFVASVYLAGLPDGWVLFVHLLLALAAAAFGIVTWRRRARTRASGRAPLDGSAALRDCSAGASLDRRRRGPREGTLFPPDPGHECKKGRR